MNQITDHNLFVLFSIDLTLSSEFRFYKPGLEILDVKEETNYVDITEKRVLKEGESYLLLPGCACLGITEETVELSPNLCGLLGNIIEYSFH